MLKLFRWIYRLGYKHAETKYYHALRARLMSHSEYDLNVQQLHTTKSESNEKRIQERLGIDHRLQQVIEDVFRPNSKAEHIIVEPKNRFMP